MQLVKRLGAGLVGVAAVLGMKFYNKSTSEDETRAELVALCEQDQACLAVVEEHFEHCHEEAYSIGGRRSSGRLDVERLAGCINRAGGEEYFSVEDESGESGEDDTEEVAAEAPSDE